jgi:hypothetical protein
MGTHTFLTNSRVRQLFSEKYQIKVKKIEPVAAGRLSFPFILHAEDGHKFFGKISKLGNGDNIPLSTFTTEAARFHGIPCPRTYAKSPGKRYTTMPKRIGNDSVPEELQGQTITLSEYVEPNILETIDTHAMHAIGRYIGTLGRLAPLLNHIPSGITGATDNPHSMKNCFALLCDTFRITPSLLESMDLDTYFKELADKLPANDPLAQGFAAGIRRGDVQAIMNQVSQNENALHAIEKDLPQGLLNNDVKPNNVFAKRDPKTNHVTITAALDFGPTGKGPLVQELGRTIALSCFDSKTGELRPDLMLATIQGRTEIRPLSELEIQALPHYIRQGICQSYALRSSYFSAALHGERDDAQIDRLNPSLHIQELKSVDSWFRSNNLSSAIQALVPLETAARHNAVYLAEKTFQKTNLYKELRDTSSLRHFFDMADSAHALIRGENALCRFKESQCELKKIICLTGPQKCFITGFCDRLAKAAGVELSAGVQFAKL